MSVIVSMHHLFRVLEARLEKALSGCDHDGMEMRLNPDNVVEFYCAKCNWGGMMHRDQLAEYEKLGSR